MIITELDFRNRTQKILNICADTDEWEVMGLTLDQVQNWVMELTWGVFESRFERIDYAVFKSAI